MYIKVYARVQQGQGKIALITTKKTARRKRVQEKCTTHKKM